VGQGQALGINNLEGRVDGLSMKFVGIDVVDEFDEFEDTVSILWFWDTMVWPDR